MSLEPCVWQHVRGSAEVAIYPIVGPPSFACSNCYILSAPRAIVIIDPGAGSKQARVISEVVAQSLLKRKRPVLILLTHCHHDHSHNADSLILPPETRFFLCAHELAAEALETGDRELTWAFLFPGDPRPCTAPVPGRFFSR